jgi:hypothetical protein
METSKLPISEEQLSETAVTPVSMVRQTNIINAWEEISAIIKCPGKDQIIISINEELFILLHRVMKQHWVSGTDRF